jgi:predicted RecA/RadA family phage recombinase
MATNYIQDGATVTVAAPYDRLSGQGALIGSALFGVALSDVLSGATGDFMTEGVFSLAKTSAQAWVLGDRIYWDNSNKRCDTDPTKGPLIGVATAAAANPSSTGYVKLSEGIPGLDEGAQGATIAALTDNSGGAAADGTIGVVTLPTLAGWNGSTDPTAAEATQIITAVTANRDAVKELSTKVNLIIAALKTAGVIASS